MSKELTTEERMLAALEEMVTQQDRIQDALAKIDDSIGELARAIERPGGDDEQMVVLRGTEKARAD